MIAYQANWVCPGTAPPIRNGFLVVHGNRIAAVGTDQVPPGTERVAFPGCTIVPGFVNAHTHLELTLFRGLLDDLSFPDWIRRLTRMKYEMCTQDALRASARLGAAEMLRAGVTTVGEVMDIPTGWEAMLEFGLQGVAYQEVFGPADETAAEAVRALRGKVERHRKQETATQRIGLSPHAPFSVSPTLYKGVREYASQEGLRMTAHIAESGDETSFVRDGSGPFGEAHRKRGIEVIGRGCSPVAHLDHLGLLGPDMLLIHAIETDAEDHERIRESGAFVAHCPKSNAYLGHRVAPVAAMRKRGIPVALGTDSVASNNAFDMFGEMRAVVEQQNLSCEEAFRMATIEGARALGLDRELGTLEAGKRADFSVLTLRNPGANPIEEVVQHASPVDIRKTFLGGREVNVEVEEFSKEVGRIQLKLNKYMT
jgi:cytosine/adenosine deaminase-related metal-dependent hydrolase